MGELISLQVNGRALQVKTGTSVAAAVFVSGEHAFHRSVSGEPRAALCGMGICYECRLTVNGRANSKSCQILVANGMTIETR